MIGFRAAAINNALIDGGDVLDVSLTEIGGDAQSATDLKDFADAGYDPGTNKVEGVKLVDTTTTNTDMVGTASAALASVCTEGRLSELDGANIPADVDTLLTRLSAARAGYLDNLNIGELVAGISDITGLNDLTALEVENAVWDAILTGASHNDPTSAGRRLRQLANIFVLDTGTAQAGSAGTITLAAGANAGNDFYNHTIVVITAGAGIGQARAINAYNGTSKVATIVPNWVDNPNGASEYEILADTEKHVYEVHADAIVAASFATDAISADALATDTAEEIRDAIWNAILTAATYNIATSAGRRLRDISTSVIVTGTSPNSGGNTNTAIRIELNGDASSMDGAYDPAAINIVGGTGEGQSRQIFEYDGTNKLAYVNRDWKEIPDDTSQYTISTNSGNSHVNEGLAQGGGATSITLNTLASAVNNTYVGQVVFLFAGTGQDQARRITAYNGTTKEATVATWETNPDNGTVYAVLPLQANDLSAAEVWQVVLENSKTAEQIIRIMLSALVSKSAGGGTPSLTFRDNADTKNRITVTADANGNRTASSQDGT